MDSLEELIPPDVRKRLATFHEWLSKTVGLPKGFTDNPWYDHNDWTLVIMLHAMLEAGLNHLLTAHFQKPELGTVFPHLDNSDIKRGKLAFVFRLKLLPKDQITFIQQLSTLRNFLVHNARNFDFKLKEYPDTMKPGDRKKWIELLALGYEEVETRTGKKGLALKKAESIPRASLHATCYLIMEHILKASINPS